MKVIKTRSIVREETEYTAMKECGAERMIKKEYIDPASRQEH